MLPDFHDESNYGYAVINANLVLGRLAIRQGRLDQAKEFLASPPKFWSAARRNRSSRISSSAENFGRLKKSG